MSVVSLVVVTRDCEAHVGATIGSIRRQSHAELEVVIWDDGSTDDTLAHAQHATADDERFRVVAGERLGTMSALRHALNTTSGPHVCWVVGDDALTPDAVTRSVAALARFPEATFVYSQYARMTKDGVIGVVGEDCKIPYTRERLLTSFMTTQFRLLRRSAFDAVGGLDTTLGKASDYDLCLKLSEQGLVLHVPHVLYFRRDSLAGPLEDQRAHLACMQLAIERALQRRGLAERFEVELELFGRFGWE